MHRPYSSTPTLAFCAGLAAGSPHRRDRRLLTLVVAATLVATALLGSAVASAQTILAEDFEAYLPGSNLIGQGGWFAIFPTGVTGTDIRVNVGTYLGTQVGDGFFYPGTPALTFAKRLFGVGVGSNANLVLRFDAFARLSSYPPSNNNGVYLSTAGSPLAVGWFMRSSPAPSGPDWVFDARGLTGVLANAQTFPGGFDTPVALEVIVDPLNLEVHGRYDFGSGYVATAPFPITAAQFAAIDGIVMHQDHRWPGSATGAEFDNIVVTVSSLEVAIDIKPGSDPNAIRPRSTGKIPVAILTTSIADGDPLDFDAWEVDPLSLTFGPDGATIVHANGHAEDVDGDGDLDMVIHFKTRETGIACGDTEATLTGETFGGQAVEGTDSIKTTEC